ncbi:MAG: hypothetical protein AAGG68_06895 [Bacteroidota bacterium]
MKYLIFLTGLMLFQSCSNNESTATSVQGQVIDIVKGDPIEGLRIFVTEYDFSLAGLGGGRDIAILESDEEGRFEHEFDAKSLKRYRCRIDLETPNLSTGLGDADNYIEDLTAGETNIVEFKTTFSGYVKEAFVNVICDTSIVLEITRQNSIPEAINNLTFELKNCQTLIRNDFFPSPMGKHIYTWRTLRDGEVITEDQDSFNLAIGERKEFTIEW